MTLSEPIPGIRIVFALGLAVFVAACGDDETSAISGAGPTPTTTPPSDEPPPDPAAPAPPAAPTLACPRGFRVVDGEEAGDPSTCDPWPRDGGPDACGPGEAHFPGEPGCRRIGEPCPAGEWATPAGATKVIYVRAGGALGGNGSVAAPYGTIDEAVAVAKAGDTIALGKGTHVGNAHVPAGATLWGACVEQTFLESPIMYQQTVWVSGADANIGNFTIQGSGNGVSVLGDGASASIESLLVTEIEGAGISVRAGAVVTGKDIVIRDVHAFGIESIKDASVTVEHAVIDAAVMSGVFTWQHGTASLSYTAVRNVKTTNGYRGTGLDADDGGTVVAQASAVEGCEGWGIHVANAPDEPDADAGTVELHDVVVRDTFQAADSIEQGQAADLYVEIGTLTGERVWLSKSHGLALGVLEGKVSLTDVVIDRPDDPSTGVSVRGAGSVELTRAFISGMEVFGFGIRQATLETSKAGSAHLSDVTIRGPANVETNQSRSIVARDGASVAIERAALVRSMDGAIVASDEGTTLTVSDLLVGATGPDAAGFGGRGLQVVTGATASVTRSAFTTNRDVAVYVGGKGSSLDLTDVAITDTAERACAGGPCAGSGAGFGLGVYDGATVKMKHFNVARSALAGLQVAREGSLDLESGAVRDNPIGANVQDAPPESAIVEQQVYWDNDRDVDAETVEVPTEPELPDF